MTSTIPGTDRVPNRVIVERIRDYLPDVPQELLLGLVKGTHAVVPREPTEAMREAYTRAVNDTVWDNQFKMWVFKDHPYKAMLAAAERDDG